MRHEAYDRYLSLKYAKKSILYLICQFLAMGNFCNILRSRLELLIFSKKHYIFQSFWRMPHIVGLNTPPQAVLGKPFVSSEDTIEILLGTVV